MGKELVPKAPEHSSTYNVGHTFDAIIAKYSPPNLTGKGCRAQKVRCLPRDGDNKVTFQEQILGVYLKPLPPLTGHHAMLSHFISQKSLHQPVCRDKEHQRAG